MRQPHYGRPVAVALAPSGRTTGEDTWGLTRGFKALQAPLPLAGRLRGVLGAGVAVAGRSVFYARPKLLLRRPIALQLIGAKPPWHPAEALQELGEELLGCLLVPSPLYKHIQRTTVLIHGAPQVMAFALHRPQNLTQRPL